VDRSGGARPSTAAPAGTATQISFVELGTPLSDVTFVVVDLETTGGAPVDAGITEIGAVKVLGGVVIGEFQTLVNPGQPIPPFVAALTGITDALVATAPPLGAALPSFLEFARGSVLVAHNAPYDVGFLKGACAKLGFAWPEPAVVDTARIARVALHRDEVPNCKLGTLAAHFRATVTPTHRAFDDARATADVLHALIGRAGDLGVSTLEDLHAFTSRVSAAQRTKRHLAQGLPDSPGVYVFQDAQGVALYVGTSKSIRTRVRTYFTASEQRRRMAEMVRIAERVVPIVCATTLEARVRELRIIAAEQPRYNVRSRRPDSQTWLKLTDEPAPRLVSTRTVADDQAAGARYLGPFTSRAAATAATEALLLAYPLRTCTTRIARKPRATEAGCALAELGRCLAPCMADGDRIAYDAVVAGARAAMSGDVRAVADAVELRMARLAEEERYEEAAGWRERLGHLVEASVRTHRLAMIAGTAELVAAVPTADRGWDIHVIRYGRLAAAGHAPAGTAPRPIVDALIATAEHVESVVPPAPAGLSEEALELLRWLESDGVRLVRSDVSLGLPLHCGGSLVTRLGAVRRSAQRTAAGDDYRSLADASRPRGPVDARPVSRILSA
jgi:DNA polymerase-3 subunit epsilon